MRNLINTLEVKKRNKLIGKANFNCLGFTLIEILVGILISSIIIIVGFYSFNVILLGKVKLIESTNIEKESFKFSQKFFEEIKAGGLIDYEEYFNRSVVNGNSTGNDLYSSGHFLKPTGFGNFGKLGNPDNDLSTNYGNLFYYCRSGDNLGAKMTGDGCYNNNSFNTVDSQYGKPQRYGQYSFQFIDYNANYDEDRIKSDNSILLGDEDGDGNIIGDDDDEFLGEGPEAFKIGEGVTELYLISADKTKRTLFRWTVKNDPDYKDNTSCDFSNPKAPTGSGCLGTIEFLRLEGKDTGIDHNWSGNGEYQYDGIIDTWYINKDFSGTKDYSEGIGVVAGNDSTNYWLPLFPNSINVKSFDIQAYPNKDIKYAWKESGIDIAPYIRVNMTLTPSWKVKKAIKGKVPEFNISTTVNLTEIFSR